MSILLETWALKRFSISVDVNISLGKWEPIIDTVYSNVTIGSPDII
jgi:hypothetical protein